VSHCNHLLFCTLLESLATYTVLQKKRDNIFPTFHKASFDHVPKFWSLAQMWVHSVTASWNLPVAIFGCRFWTHRTWLMAWIVQWSHQLMNYEMFLFQRTICSKLNLANWKFAFGLILSKGVRYIFKCTITETTLMVRSNST
jgi:hypothetical protein